MRKHITRDDRFTVFDNKPNLKSHLPEQTQQLLATQRRKREARARINHLLYVAATIAMVVLVTSACYAWTR